MNSHWFGAVLALALAAFAGCSKETDDGRTGDRDSPSGDSAAGDTAAGDATGDSGPLPFAVQLTTPAPGAEGVPPDSPVAILFTEPPAAATLQTQAAWGACDPASTVLISADNFSTCAGGTLASTSDNIVVFTPTHGLLDPNRTYQVRVTDTVTNVSDTPLEQTFTLSPGFSVGFSLCRAVNDPADKTTLGAACVAPSFVDNGDGTITDRANKLLWSRCSMAGDGSLKNGVDFACETPVTPNDWVNWETAIAACENLVHAGRSDWKLPDLAELLTLLEETGDPAIDTTFFPQTSNLWYGASTTYVSNVDAHYAVLFGYMDFRGPGFGGKHRPGGAGASFFRCVAGHIETPAPVLNDLRMYDVDPTEVALFTPAFFTALGEFPTKLGYIGLDGSIGASGTVVVNALEGPVDLTAASATADFYVFDQLTGGTTYRIIVTAENAAGHSVEEIVVSTDPVAPILEPLVISNFTDTSITLASPTFSRAGNPSPAVQAWIGIDGTITATDDVITNALQGPYDVSTQAHEFTPLDTNQTHRIWVIASNTAGYSRGSATQHLGRFINNLDGTVTDPRTGLTWLKCLVGQTWVSGTDSCAGAEEHLQFCNEFDNDCNGGSATGLLGPPWLNNNECGSMCTLPGYSSAWEACNHRTYIEYAGRAGWRIPTTAELLSLESGGDCRDDVAFPIPPGYGDDRVISAESSSMLWFNAVDGACDVRDASGKDDTFWVRCVTSE